MKVREIFEILKEIKNMSSTRVLEVLKTKWNGSPMMALACFLLVAFAAAPLHAQFAYQDVYDFNCSTGGCEPNDYGQLTQGADGNLYGTAIYDSGSYDCGTVFMVTPSGAYSDLWYFDGTSGCTPEGALTLASDDNFYGVASTGGNPGNGTLFRFIPPSTLTVLHNFNGTDGGSPQVAPIQAKDGNLYGVTGMGTAYRVTLPLGTFKQLPYNAPGQPSAGPLLAASDGYLYGTTFNGGTSDLGTIFRMTTGGVIKILYNFSGTDGANPSGALTQGSDGNLYGTTIFGGANNTGEIFQLVLPSKLNVIHSFSSVPSNGENSDGAGPLAGLLAASDGYLYGSSAFGGINTCGTLFQIKASGTSAAFSKIADFPNSNCTDWTPGIEPYSALLQHTNGCFYGTTALGGASGGNVYSLCPASPPYTVGVEGTVWVKPSDRVVIVGNNLSEVSQVSFAGVQAQFQPGSNTYLIATVPSAAVDGLITVTISSPVGEQQIESQHSMRILPQITNLDPSSGPVGTQVGIVGGGFVGAKKVTFGGVKATSFRVVTPTLIQATVPAGAKTGKVSVITSNGTATSKETFTVN